LFATVNDGVHVDDKLVVKPKLPQQPLDSPWNRCPAVSFIACRLVLWGRPRAAEMVKMDVRVRLKAD